MKVFDDVEKTLRHGAKQKGTSNKFQMIKVISKGKFAQPFN